MFEEKIKQIGITIPEVVKPLAAYIPAMQVGNLVMTSGQVPISEGKVKYSGKVGSDLSEEEGKEAAKLCALNCLSAIKSVIGNLDKIKRVVKLTVFVSSAEGFTAQPKVANVRLGSLHHQMPHVVASLKHRSRSLTGLFHLDPTHVAFSRKL